MLSCPATGITRKALMDGVLDGMETLISVGFNIPGFDEFFPSGKLSRLERRELLRCVGHDVETQFK
jgi:hypothetical protein